MLGKFDFYIKSPHSYPRIGGSMVLSYLFGVSRWGHEVEHLQGQPHLAVAKEGLCEVIIEVSPY